MRFLKREAKKKLYEKPEAKKARIKVVVPLGAAKS